MARLYHPDLGSEYECPDDEGLLGVLADAGWLPAPEPERASPAHAPEPVKYEPVVAEATKPRRGTKTSSDKTEDPK